MTGKETENCPKMSIDPVSKILFPEFYDLVRQPKDRIKRKCLRCKAPVIGDRICNKCSKFNKAQSRMVQDGDSYLGSV